MIEKQYILDNLKDIIDDSIFLVDLKVSTDAKIRLYIDKFEGIKLEECMNIHKQLYPIIEKKIEDFELEVSSPGLSGPLNVWQQYVKIIDNDVNITTKEGLNFTGKLNFADENQIKVQKSKNEELTLNYSEIKKAKQVIKF